MVCRYIPIYMTMGGPILFDLLGMISGARYGRRPTTAHHSRTPCMSRGYPPWTGPGDALRSPIRVQVEVAPHSPLLGQAEAYHGARRVPSGDAPNRRYRGQPSR